MGKWAKGMRKIVEWVEAISIVSKNENNKDNLCRTVFHAIQDIL